MYGQFDGNHLLRQYIQNGFRLRFQKILGRIVCPEEGRDNTITGEF